MFGRETLISRNDEPIEVLSRCIIRYYGDVIPKKVAFFGLILL